MTNPQCIHIPDGSVVVSGELFDMACAAIAERDRLLAEFERLSAEYEAMRLRLERYCKAYGPEPTQEPMLERLMSTEESCVDWKLTAETRLAEIERLTAALQEIRDFDPRDVRATLARKALNGTWASNEPNTLECRRAGLSEHAAGTGPGDTRAEARSSRREITAQSHEPGGSLLRKPSEHAPPGCHCQDRCMAPVIMGRQTPCRDPEKAGRFVAKELFGAMRDTLKSLPTLGEKL